MSKAKTRTKRKSSKRKGEPISIRDRIVEFTRVSASSLKPHKNNPRTHPDKQRDAMNAVLGEIGFADALVVRRVGKSYQILDGHLRAEISKSDQVPILVVDLNDDEAKQFIASHDTIAGFADIDVDIADDLLSDIEFADKKLDKLIRKTIGRASVYDDPRELPEIYNVLVVCASESEQQTVFDLCKLKGWECRIQSL